MADMCVCPASTRTTSRLPEWKQSLQWFCLISEFGFQDGSQKCGLFTGPSLSLNRCIMLFEGTFFGCVLVHWGCWETNNLTLF